MMMQRFRHSAEAQSLTRILSFWSVLLFCALSPVAVCLAATAKSTPLYTYDLAPVNAYDLSSTTGKNNALAEVHVVAALQGLVNRTAPQLYVYFITADGQPPGYIDRFWLDKMREPGSWLAKKPLQPIDTLEALVAKFRSAYDGVVLYDLNVPATSNVASTVAGCDNLLPIPYDPTPGSVYDRLVVHGPKLPIKMRLIKADGTPLFTGAETGSAKCDAYLWAKRRYLDTGKCNPTLMGYYIDSTWVADPKKGKPTSHMVCNHDYFIAHKGFFFDLSPWADEAPQDDLKQRLGTDFKTLCAILLSAYNATHGKKMIHIGGFPPWEWKYTNFTGGSHDPVATEWRCATIISCYNAYMDADAGDLGAIANASVFSLFPLSARYPQPKPGLTDWKKAGYVDAAGHVVPHEYVTIYGGDYDSAGWVYQKLPSLWADAGRGSVPINWAFNPNLADRFPVGLDWARRTATPNDHFIAGDSGAGYINPGNLDGDRPFSHLPSGVATWEAHCRHYYKQWDISISGEVIDGESRLMSADALAAYARFSPDGLVAQKLPSYQGLVPGTQTPYIGTDNDMPNPDQMDEAMRRIQINLNGESPDVPHFHQYRTVLWYPSQQKPLWDEAQSRLHVTMVDYYTFMGLLRLYLTQHN